MRKIELLSEIPLTFDIVHRIPEDIDPFPLLLQSPPALMCKRLFLPGPVRVISEMVKGLGMGMAAVYGIVMNHDGGISVDSELGKGTAVQIYLPAIEIKVEKPKKAEVEVVRGSGTILMIEDVVIEVIQAMLEMLGYRVMVAKTGKDAIHITKTFDGQIDLALLDIKLPDIDGRNLYPLIMKARSNLKVIVFSGYSIDGPAREILDAGAQDFIQKPFSLATLSEKLKEVFEGK
jgi:CheY-like chemotaxis protein